MPKLCAMLDRFTMRLSSDGVLTIVSSSSDVSKKCPRWFTCICNSFPSFVSLRDGGAMTPELFTSASNRSYFASNALANARTDSKSAKSTSMTSTVALRRRREHARLRPLPSRLVPHRRDDPPSRLRRRLRRLVPESRVRARDHHHLVRRARRASSPRVASSPRRRATLARRLRRRLSILRSRRASSRASRAAVAVAPARASLARASLAPVASRRVASRCAVAASRIVVVARDALCASSRRAAPSPSLPTHRARDLAGAHDGAVLAVRFSRERRARA